MVSNFLTGAEGRETSYSSVLTSVMCGVGPARGAPLHLTPQMQFVQDIEYPKEFPPILMDLSREVLRAQPRDINKFCLEYFQQLKAAGPAE